MSFIDKIKKSSKSSLKQLLEVVKNDVRLTTGHNLRSIMMLAEKNTIEDLEVENADFEYYKLEENEEWKANIAQELIDIRHGGLKVPRMEADELKEILDYICTG